LSLVSTQLAVIGRSLVGVDPYMPGAVDEFRIYAGALRAQEVALSHKNGPGSTSRDPGALLSVKVPPASYPAYSAMVPPVIWANYANLTNFNLLPNNNAIAPGLTMTSSDTNVLEVLSNNMLRTHRPGAVILSASYLGRTDSATVLVKNVATLTHRYSFAANADDSVGTANGTLQGTASVSGGSLVLDGNPGSYLQLPPGLLEGYDAVTVDTWVTFNAAATWARLWYFGNDRADEFYLAPSVTGGSAHWYSAGIPYGGATITISPQWQNQALHVTCVFGNGSMEYYTNGVLHGANNGIVGTVDQVGNWFSWIGKSPYPDPYVNASVAEFRIYRGRLAPDEILGADVVGPNALLSTFANVTTTHAGNNVVLRWPVAAAGFSVQATPSLSGGTWSTLTNEPVLNGTNWQVTLPISVGPQFFRVWH